MREAPASSYRLTFHAITGTWSYRATTADGHTITLTATLNDTPLWTLAVDDGEPQPYNDLDDAMTDALNVAIAA